MDLLAARGLSPLHRYGQNFLVRAAVLDRIVSLAGVEEGDVILEVGPGLGGLTERLLRRGASVLAVEIDRGLVACLGEILGNQPRFRLCHRDVMAKKSAIAPEVLRELEALGAFRRPGGWKVVSNLPFQISSPFLGALPLLPCPPAVVVVTVQKEVAAVLSAPPGSASYSALSLLAGLYFQVGRGPVLPPSCFYPPPKVESQVVRLDWRGPPALPAVEVVAISRCLLQGRRKRLRSTLPRALAVLAGEPPPPDVVEGILAEAGVAPSARIEALAPEEVERLCGAALRHFGRGA